LNMGNLRDEASRMNKASSLRFLSTTRRRNF
jgi:hypothetical protein